MGMSELRRSAWLIVVAAVVPLLLFVIMQTGFDARAQRANARSNALAASQAMSIAMDGEVLRITSGIDVVGTDTALRADDATAFVARATELVALNEGWRAVMLLDVDSGKLLESTTPAAYVIQTTVDGPPGLKPRFIGFARGPGCPCLLFDRLASGPADTRWAVRVLVSNAGLMRLMPPSNGLYPASAITDPAGRFLARSISGDARFGTPGSTYLRDAVASGQEIGTYRGVTLEGVENYTAFARSPLTGWTAHVALPSEAIDSPARRFFASIGLAALLSLLLAAILIWFALRQVREARQMSERLLQAQKLEALGQLTGGIAHDFNNLLTVIRTYCELILLEISPTSPHRSELTEIHSAAERAGTLARQLLSVGRRNTLLAKPLDLNEVIQGVEAMLRRVTRSGGALKGISISIRPSVPSIWNVW